MPWHVCRLGILLVLSLPALVEGLTGVCGNEAGVRAFGTMDVRESPLGSPDCFVIPEAQTAAQAALWDTTPDKRLLAVMDGLLVMKSPADVAVIVAADTAQTALQAEAATNPVCTAASLEVALTLITTEKTAIMMDVDAMTDIPTAQTALTSAVNRLTALETHIVNCIVVMLRKHP